MSPQLAKAAAFVLDNPVEVGFASVRDLAEAADVKPNSLVRMAQAIGFEGYEDFREPFREDLRNRTDFTDRAAWLQAVAAEGRLGSVYADIAGAALSNLEEMFAGVPASEIKEVADKVVAARRTYVLGVGANHALARNFAYLAGMAVDTVVVSAEGNLPMDTAARAAKNDIVIAMTFAPYRAEVVEAVEVARDHGASVIAITDSHGSPIATGADHVLVCSTEGPQFFPSTLAAAALLETLASFIVADAPKEVVSGIDELHRRRYDLGVYWSEE